MSQLGGRQHLPPPPQPHIPSFLPAPAIILPTTSFAPVQASFAPVQTSFAPAQTSFQPVPTANEIFGSSDTLVDLEDDYQFDADYATYKVRNYS